MRFLDFLNIAIVNYWLSLYRWVVWSKGGVWVVVRLADCKCERLLPAEQRTRSLKGSLKPKEVRETVGSYVSGPGRHSKVKLMSRNVYNSTGELLKYDQARYLYLTILLFYYLSILLSYYLAILLSYYRA